LRKTLALSIAALMVGVLPLAGCGSSDKNKKDSGTSGSTSSGSKFEVTVSETGKTAKYSVPSTVKGGLVTETLVNHGKAPHGGQLVRIEGNHTAQEALKVVGGNSDKTPDWVRGEGGVGGAAPGAPSEATVVLPPGKYLVGDFGGPSEGKPGYAQFTVTAGKGGSLPSTPTTVTAANPGKDKYKWDISGDLKAGKNTITFDSKGKEAIHLIAAARVTGKHSNAELVKAVGSNGKPPSYLDQTSFVTSSVLDGGKSEVTSFDFRKPGRYVLFCPLTDREGGKSHEKEGLLTQVDVK
jgi:hypothetical protein